MNLWPCVGGAVVNDGVDGVDDSIGMLLDGLHSRGW